MLNMSMQYRSLVQRGTVLEMDKLDRELRHTIRKIWPAHSRKLLPLLIPYKTGLCRHHCYERSAVSCVNL